MNKKTILTLIMIASLHGQLVAANEVAISQTRLQSISAQELAMLTSYGAARIAGGHVILNVNTLDLMLKNPMQQKQFALQAKKMASNFVPYGNTVDIETVASPELIQALSARFIPYGCT